MKPSVLFSHLFDSSESSQEASFATMPAADEDLITADSEGEFHSFTDQDFSDFSSKYNSPIVDRERHIGVDPLSLKQLGKLAGRSPSGAGTAHSPTSSRQPPVLIKPKFVSLSLPSSALSSPKGFPKTSRKWYNPAHPPHPALTSMARQHSAALSRFAEEQKVLTLRRSKSCGEGRASEPSDGFVDILSRRPTLIHDRERREEEVGRTTTYDRSTTGAYETSEEGSFKDPRARIEQLRARRRDNFRCGCVFLPGLSSKKKQVVVRANKVRLQLQPNNNNNNNAAKMHANHLPKNNNRVDRQHVNVTTHTTLYEKTDEVKTHHPQPKQREVRESSIDKARVSTVSTRGVSLEKFDCGSWSSSAILEGDDDEGGQSYFDLPLELIRCGHNDTDSPVRAAFVFEKDLKGVLKKSTSKLASRKSHEMSNRHVRFSTSLPTSYPASPSSTCITPRLRKAREEFNAFLEAQSA